MLALLLVILLMLASLGLMILSVSPLFLQAIIATAYILLGGSYLSWPFVIFVWLLAAFAEFIEFYAGYRGAKKAKASKRGAWGALIGGIAGSILGTPLSPLGPIAGAFIGTYIGCLLLEITAKTTFKTAHVIGWKATLAKVWGTAFKLSFAIATVFATAIYGFWKWFQAS